MCHLNRQPRSTVCLSGIILRVLPGTHVFIHQLPLFNVDSQDVVVCSIYMPWNNDTDDHMIEFVSVLGCIQSIIDRHVHVGCLFVFGGD